LFERSLGDDAPLRLGVARGQVGYAVVVLVSLLTDVVQQRLPLLELLQVDSTGRRNIVDSAVEMRSDVDETTHLPGIQRGRQG
jgi:hypothetical protein